MVGHDVVEKPPFFMKHSGGPKVIHVNFFESEIDPVYFPDLDVVGDIGNAIWQIKETLGPRPAGWDHSGLQALRPRLLRAVACDAHNLAAFPLHPARVVRDVRAALPDDGIVCLDNGVYKIWFARCYEARQPNTLLLDNALATMGAGLPSAMGSKLVGHRQGLPSQKVARR